jgi:hypothetical protein
MVFAGAENFCLVHVSLVPVIGVVGEQVHYTFVFSMCLRYQFGFLIDSIV